MITPVSMESLASRAGWPSTPTGTKGPLVWLVAEYLRAALTNAWVGDPISIHNILGFTADRLGVVFPLRSSSQAQFFNEDNSEDTSRHEFRIILEWLAELGDVVSVGHGWYYPSPGRLVELPSKDYALISGTASEQLERELSLPVRSGAIGRLVHTIPETPLVRESFRDWLDVPPSLANWTRQMLAMPLDPLETDASKWEVAHYEPLPKFRPPVDSDFGPLVVARVKREGMPGYHRYLTRLVRKNGEVGTHGAREISFHDCTRLMNGIRLDRGLPGERVVARSSDAGHLMVATSRYQLPEVIRLLTFFSVHRADSGEGDHSFWIPVRHEHRLGIILDELGIKLTSHGRKL